MSDNLIDKTISTIENLHIFDFSDDIIDSILRNQDFDTDDAFNDIINEVSQDTQPLEKLIELMSKLRESEAQDSLWDKISSEDKSPAAFQPLCYGLMEKTGKPKQLGVILYVTLLGLHPINLIWNSTIFNNVLSIMITASQAIEASKIIGSEEKYCIQLSAKVLDALSYSINESFCKLAGSEVVIALIELSMKMCTIYQKELEKYSQELTPKAIKFLDAASETSLDYILPFLVLALLLDFLPQGKNINNKISQIVNTLLQFCEKHLSSEPDKMIRVIKHLFVRTPDRIALKENTAGCIHFLMKTLEDQEPIISFILNGAKASKASYRSLSLDLFRLLINDEEYTLSDELKFQMIDIIKLRLNDTIPNVRASAINSITSLISTSDSRINEVIGLNDPEGEIYKIIENRICDEKLIVRKAALKFVRSIVFSSDEPNFTLLLLISARARDRSVSIRQEAAQILTDCLVQFNYHPQLITIWFDSVFPIALDTDQKTQELGLKLIETTFFKEITHKTGIAMAECLNDRYKDLIYRIFCVFKQKAKNLGPFCKSLQSILKVDCLPVMWKIADSIISVDRDDEFVIRDHFKKDFKVFWDQRDELPTEYLSIISKLGYKDDFIIRDSLDFIEKISSENAEIENEAEDTENSNESETKSFAKIHAYILILLKHKDNKNSTIIDEVSQILSKVTTKINNTISSRFLNQQELILLVPSIFLVGELISFLKNVFDFDFTGLQILIGEKLPNNCRIPSRVRAIATVSIGKLCLGRRDITNSFVAAFAHVLHHSSDSSVKCNSLIVLCDLCVKYSATVDSYVMNMSGCFADHSTIVRRQALLIMTRLIAEDYVKMRPLLLFRFIYSIVDKDNDVSNFAQSCLFDILNNKDPKLLSQHFIDALFYFNDQMDLIALNEDLESHSLFRIPHKEDRIKAYHLIISRMNNPTLFELLQNSCTRVLQSYPDETIDLREGESLLADTLEVMQLIEDQMEAVKIDEVSLDDPKSEKVVEQGRIYLTMLHDNLIKHVLPILNQMHRFLREKNSPLQSELRKFFRKFCEKHPSLLDELRRQEPILAAELEHDISMTQTPELSSSQSLTFINRTPFRSPLLSKIAKTPQRTMIALSGNNSPISYFAHSDSQHAENNEQESSQKGPPVQLMLDDE
ncbi:Condensin-2 complex subunit D3 [Tritrichomonas musculus]|uniref:Condensin-2 complex subunit D3 n=1 Tax=Tritrichomonas musculus TaxID=1915356 RepID=A0ABR2GWS2_9EUKA